MTEKAFPTNEERRIAGKILSSKSETDIVSTVASGGRKRFSELQEELNMTSGRLNYHLIRLRALGILSRGHEGYSLTQKGKKIAQKYL